MTTEFITADEFFEWKRHPVTKQLITILTEDKNNIFREWEDGTLLHDPIANAKMTGQMQAIKSILEFEPEIAE